MSLRWMILVVGVGLQACASEGGDDAGSASADVTASSQGSSESREKAILDAATATRTSLGELERSLSGELDAIAFKAFQESRDMTKTEQARRSSVLADLSAVRDVFKEMAFVTARWLDQGGSAEATAELDRGLGFMQSGSVAALDHLRSDALHGPKHADFVSALQREVDAVRAGGR